MCNPPWQLSKLHHVGLTVQDIERSIAFYRDTLGLTLVARRETDADYLGVQTGFPGVRLAAASLRLSPESSQSLEIVQYLTQAGESIEALTNRPGSSHVCLLVDVSGRHRGGAPCAAR